MKKLSPINHHLTVRAKGNRPLCKKMHVSHVKLPEYRALLSTSQRFNGVSKLQALSLGAAFYNRGERVLGSLTKGERVSWEERRLVLPHLASNSSYASTAARASCSFWEHRYACCCCWHVFRFRYSCWCRQHIC